MLGEVPVTFPSDTGPALVQSCHPECPQGTSHPATQIVKKGKSFLLAATQETQCLPKKSTDHSHPIDFFFFSFFFLPKYAALRVMGSFMHAHLPLWKGVKCFVPKEMKQNIRTKGHLSTPILNKNCSSRPNYFFILMVPLGHWSFY